MHVAAQSLQAACGFVQGRTRGLCPRRRDLAGYAAHQGGMPTLLEVRYTLLDIVLSLHEERNLCGSAMPARAWLKRWWTTSPALARRIPTSTAGAAVSGAVAWLRGAPSDLRQALANLREALHLAQRFGMLYDEGWRTPILGLIAAHAGALLAPISPSESGPSFRPGDRRSWRQHWLPAQSHLQRAISCMALPRRTSRADQPGARSPLAPGRGKRALAAHRLPSRIVVPPIAC